MFIQFFLVVCIAVLTSLHCSNSKGIEDPYVVLTNSNSDLQLQFAEDVWIRSRRSSSSSAITKFHVFSRVTTRYSRVKIICEVRNDGESSEEVPVDLRLPKKAFISNFSMIIDSVTYVGVVKAKAAAREQYKHAVYRGQSAGLVSADVRKIQNFAISVNIAAGSNVTFILDYEEMLERKSGVYNHVIYADPGQIVEDFEVFVFIEEPNGIASLEAIPPLQDQSYSKKVVDFEENMEIAKNNKQGFVRFQPSIEQQQSFTQGSHALVVIYDVERKNQGGEIFVKQDYFIHFFSSVNLPVIHKNVVFLIDISGSMTGLKIKQTKQALATVIDDLNDFDKFNIITFSTDVSVWQPYEMMLANMDNKITAKQYIWGTATFGSTNLYQALMSGINLLNLVSRINSLAEASMLMLLTDGVPTQGQTNPNQIEIKVTEAINRQFSLFCLGFGDDLDHAFLTKLAHNNQGMARKIYTDADAHLQLKGFYKEVASPMLLHLKMKYQGVVTGKLTTNRFDNLFEGSEIIVAGHFENLNSIAMADSFQGVVEGLSANGEVSLVTKAKKIGENINDDEFDMEKVWAYLTIKDLLKNKTFLTANKEPTDEIDSKILKISIKYNFVTPLTSMVVTKPNKEEITEIRKPRKADKRKPLKTKLVLPSGGSYVYTNIWCITLIFGLCTFLSILQGLF